MHDRQWPEGFEGFERVFNVFLIWLASYMADWITRTMRLSFSSCR